MSVSSILAHIKPIIFHSWVSLTNTFTVLYISLTLPLLSAPLSSHFHFWLRFVFDSAIFLGALFYWQVPKSYASRNRLLTITHLCSTVATSSFCFHPPSPLLFPLLFICGFAFGISSPCLLFNFMSFFSQLDHSPIHIPSLVFLFTSNIEPEATNTEESDEYQEITDATPAKKQLESNIQVRAFLLALGGSILPLLLPYFLLLSHTNASFSHLQLFALFSVCGRICLCILSARCTPYQLIALSIIGCGLATCLLVEPWLSFGCSLLGFFSSFLLPSILIYLRISHHFSVQRCLPILCASSLSHPVLPIALSLSFSRLFVLIYFGTLIILILVFVSLLNQHAQLDRQNGTSSSLTFLLGESLLRRTRSIRPFINRLRTSSRRLRRPPSSASQPLTPSPVPKIRVDKPANVT
ncbi:hypothetical protein WR25_01705 [Diploscapter pachys]|uniref:Transmembrane protein n=1 Tax=Diploscapter pachys TaxID=2018661 RepID=A0A2A2JST9_9BILA|nr:hypothetical protein WR25_01705 [Diploscapter pachys]